MELKRALKILNIEQILKDKKKEGTDLVLKGLFESCNELNKAIQTVQEFINADK